MELPAEVTLEEGDVERETQREAEGSQNQKGGNIEERTKERNKT